MTKSYWTKHSISILAICATMTFVAQAQTDSYIISREGKVTLQPSFQSWSDGNEFSLSHYGTMISVYLPVSRSANFSLRGGHAITSGDVEALSGATDIQLGAGVYLERQNLMLSLGANLPTGKRELDSAEFVTSSVVSSPILNMRYPVLGQGLNINPGLAWVVPVSNVLVVGLGAAYQYKGSYKPLAGEVDYDPGDEILLTGGIDIQPDRVSSLSLDAVFTAYGKDKVNNVESFASGSTIAGNIQYTRSFQENELRVFTRYRSKGKSEVGSPSGLVPEPLKTEPNRWEANVAYHLKFNRSFSATVFVDGRFFEETVAFYSGAKLFGIGASPTIALSQSIRIPVLFRVQFGSTKERNSTTQFEVSAGVVTSF